MASSAPFSSHDRDFHHPFQPYDIQKQFMNALYECLEDGKVGIFESPTGTGKSLSLICGSMTWLRDYKRRDFANDTTDAIDDAREPDWIVANSKHQRRQVAIQRREERETRLNAIRQKEERARTRFESGEPPHKRQKLKPESRDLGEEEEDAEFLLRDYESDNGFDDAEKRDSSSTAGLSIETQNLMQKLGYPLVNATEQCEFEPEDELKLFFCSRTHSQLSQFANEMRRVKMPPSISEDSEQHEIHEIVTIEDLKHVTLGSRKQLCINSKVNKMSSATAINERCLELQQSDTPPESKCKYLPNKDNEVLVADFRDHALARIRDIEDFGKLGKQIGICPYYASRASIKPTEIVTLPYPLLLQKSAREALKLSLKGHIVIIDEAHNLMDAISNIHSVDISLSHLKQSRSQIGVYLQKFRNKLKGKNRVYVTQLVRILDSLSSYLHSILDSTIQESQVPIGDLLKGKGVDQINLHKLMKYLQESRLARKVESYLVHMEQDSSQVQNMTNDKMSSKRLSSMPALTHVQSFLLSLTNPAIEGRFFSSKPAGVDAPEKDVLLKYRLLDPTHHFKEIVDEARAVILAGGTMSPMSDYTDHLFHYLPIERLRTFSCGHIIPASNLLVLPMSRGPHGIDLEFTFENRNSERVIMELGHSILALARKIPDGLVVFFPSYAYLDTAIQSWQKTTSSTPTSPTNQSQLQSLWSQLSSQKRIFFEPKSTTASSTPAASTGAAPSNPSSVTSSNSAASPIDTILAAYTAHIQSEALDTAGGALLFAVIGGSLSEGINFSDRLGRGIVVVGLPYPNAQSAEWKAKMEFVAQRARSASSASLNATSGGSRGAADAAAREYYENACMRAINQSVGRAIRHKDDYATVVLLDRRYERANIRGKLPAWMQSSIHGGKGFGEALGALDGFFAGKQGRG